MGNNPDTAESVLCPESGLNGLLLSVLKDSFSHFTFFFTAHFYVYLGVWRDCDQSFLPEMQMSTVAWT